MGGGGGAGGGNNFTCKAYFYIPHTAHSSHGLTCRRCWGSLRLRSGCSRSVGVGVEAVGVGVILVPLLAVDAGGW